MLANAGHADKDVTLRIYAHVVDDEDERDRLTNWVSQTPESVPQLVPAEWAA